MSSELLSADLPDKDVRERIVTRLSESQVVEAAAGTGKTRILVERLLAVVGSGTGELARAVVVTFTEKAAGELKLRVRVGLEQARQAARAANEPMRLARFELALEQLEEAHISTIHGFCADLLREYPVEAGVDPAFEVASEELAGASLFASVFASWLDEMRHELTPGLRRVLRRRVAGPWGKSPVAELFAAAQTLRANRDLSRPWKRGQLDLRGEVEEVLRSAVSLAAQAQQALDARCVTMNDVGAVITFVADLQRAEARAAAIGAAAGRDYEELEARLWSLRRGMPRYWRGRRGALRDELRRQWEAFFDQLDRFKERSGGELAAMLQEELSPCLQRYESAKRQRGQLDFMDLLLRTRDLVVGNGAVREELRARFTHIFIDEFQDTDPLQAEILLTLCGEEEHADFRAIRPLPGKLFIVGDPKQSIYRFRRAEVELYSEIKALLEQRGDAACLQLEASFRSVPDVQQAVNAIFEPLMEEASAHQAGYVPLAAVRARKSDVPAVVALPVPSPYGRNDTVTKTQVRKQEPLVVAAWIKWVLEESGWKVSVRGEEQAVAPHHICLLFRQFSGYGGDLTRPFAQALEQRNVPHLVVGGRSFYDRIEVDALVTILRVVEWPDDALSVYAALRGPLFAFDDETLLLFRESGGRFHARAPGEPEFGREVLVALEFLGALHRGRNHRPIAETVGRLYGESRCLGAFALRPNGEQAVSSLLRLQDLARRFQQSEALSFRSFVDYLELQSSGEQADADMPTMEEGSGGVRMMTVHKAKGLEFPIVILADRTAKASGRGSRVVDRASGLFAAPLCGCVPLDLAEVVERETLKEQAEEVRLLYVAATRARDVLVMPTLPEPMEGWLTPICDIFDSGGEARERPGVSRSALSAVSASFAAGVASPKTGSHPLHVWDVAALDFAASESSPLRDFELIKADGAQAGTSMERYHEWALRRAAVIERAEIPRCEVEAATSLAHHSGVVWPELLGRSAKVSVERVRGVGFGRRREGQDARDFGIFVHAVLEAVALNSSLHEKIEDVARQQARLLPATDDDVLEATDRVREALAHPLMQRALLAELSWCELPIAWRLPLEGIPLLMDGIVDLVFEHEGQLSVVDYKTDARIDPTQLVGYQRQVALYCDALERRFSQPAAGYVLFV